MPVIKGEKTAGERFPGAVQTYCIEAMMQDRKALQAGTSHFLGQNFAKASGSSSWTRTAQEQHAWTTSWGVSTRLIGGLIMTHSDDDGLVLPPKLAPTHVVILPIYRSRRGSRARDRVLQAPREGARAQRSPTSASASIVDDRDMRGGEKIWQWIKKGVPIRLEVGPRDIEKDSVFVGRRDKAPKDKQASRAASSSRTSARPCRRSRTAARAREGVPRGAHAAIDTKEEFYAYFAEPDEEGRTIRRRSTAASR